MVEEKIVCIFTWPYILRIYGHVSVPNVSGWVGVWVGPPMWFDQLFSCLAELAEQTSCTFVQ